MVGHNRTLLRSELGVTEATLKQQGNQKNTPPRSVRLIFDIFRALLGGLSVSGRYLNQ